MARILPGIVDLSWLETHDLVRLSIKNGQTLYLGTAEVLLGTQTYTAAIPKVGSLRQTLTRAADKVNFSIQNVDRQIGVTINRVETTLAGARVDFIRAARPLGLTPRGLPYTYSSCVLLTGEVADVVVDQDAADLTVVSDLAPGSSYVGNRQIEALAGIRVRGEIRAPLLGSGAGVGLAEPGGRGDDGGDRDHPYPDSEYGRHRQIPMSYFSVY